MEFFVFISSIIVLWLWWDSLKSKEIARLTGQNACQKSLVQFLDDTVELKKIWLRRNSHGHLQFCRLYFFEFSSDGAVRYSGRITMLGRKVYEVEMDAFRIPSDSM